MSTDTRWGIFEWNGSTGAFTNKVLRNQSSTTDLQGGVSIPLGAIGDYALVATNVNNPVLARTPAMHGY